MMTQVRHANCPYSICKERGFENHEKRWSEMLGLNFFRFLDDFVALSNICDMVHDGLLNV
jgi:hypothetical protein